MSFELFIKHRVSFMGKLLGRIQLEFYRNKWMSVPLGCVMKPYLLEVAITII
jgi:hypothetical protein